MSKNELGLNPFKVVMSIAEGSTSKVLSVVKSPPPVKAFPAIICTEFSALFARSVLKLVSISGIISCTFVDK